MTLRPQYNEAGLANWRMNVHMLRTKLPLPLTSTNCQHESEAILDQPILQLSGARRVSEFRWNQQRNCRADLEDHGK